MLYSSFGFMPILYSITNCLLFVPISIFVLYKGYRVVCGKKREMCWYRGGEIFMISWIVMALVFNLFCYHGIICTIKLFSVTGLGWLMGIFTALESVWLVICGLLRLMCLFKVKSITETDDAQKDEEK